MSEPTRAGCTLLETHWRFVSLALDELVNKARTLSGVKEDLEYARDLIKTINDRIMDVRVKGAKAHAQETHDELTKLLAETREARRIYE